MNWSDLEKMGFTVVGGMIDKAGVNYGRLVDPLRVELTPEGEAHVQELMAVMSNSPTAGDGVVKPKKAAVKREAPPLDDLDFDKV